MTWLNHDFMYAIAMACVHSLWQGMIILGIVSIIKSQISKLKSQHIYWIYFIGLGSMFVLWLATLVYYSNPSMQPLNLTLTGASVAYKFSPAENLISYNLVYYSVAMAWITGALLFLFKAFLGSQKIYKIKRLGSPATKPWQRKIQEISERINYRGKVLLKHTSIISIPIVVGFIKPVILMPSIYFTQLTPLQLETILVHELTHIKRNDYLFNSIQIIIESILFYHPVTWLLGKKIRQYREYICDEQVQSKVDTLPYLEALYRIADFSNQELKPAVALYNQKNDLIMRVKRMLNKPFADFQLKPFVYLFIVLIIAFSQYAFRDTLSENRHHQTTELLRPSEIKLDPEVTPATPKVDPIVSSMQILQQLEKRKVGPKRIQSIDTVPDPQKVKALQKKIQEKSLELEKLSLQFESEMKNKMEPRMKELEFKSQQLEKELAPKMKAMEEAFESQEFKEFEKRQVELELRMRESMSKLEEQVNSDEFKELEKQLEIKSEQFKEFEHSFDHDEVQAKAQKLQQEMQEIHHKMQEQMRDVQEEHQRIMNNPDMKKLQEEMELHHRKMEEIHKKHESVWNKETKGLQEEMHKLQQQTKMEMQSINRDLQKQMEIKSHELQQLHRELAKTMQLKKKH